MQETVIAELLADLEAAFDDCSRWAGGTECRQRIDEYERRYNLSALITVYKWLEAAANGHPLTAKQETEARRIISLTQWHKRNRKRRCKEPRM